MARWTMFCVAALMACACAAEDDELRHYDAHEADGQLLLIGEADELVVDGEGSLCGCDSEACEEEWMRANVGCDVCLTVVCDGDYRHRCVLCPDPDRLIADARRPTLQ